MVSSYIAVRSSAAQDLNSVGSGWSDATNRSACCERIYSCLGNVITIISYKSECTLGEPEVARWASQNVAFVGYWAYW